MNNYLIQAAPAASHGPWQLLGPEDEPALQMYADLRQQGLTSASARQHVRIVHDVDVTQCFPDCIVVTQRAG